MRHRLYVVAVVAAELLEARAEIDRATEVLGEVGEAASQGMPPDVDDPGVRQNQVDEPDTGPVEGHLVREERAIRPAAGADGREISLPPRAQGTGIQLADSLHPRCGTGAVGDAACNPLDAGQLACAFDQGMAREDLLDQRGARPGQPHDEYRCRIWTALVFAAGQKLAREHGPGFPNRLGYLVRIVRNDGAANLVCGREVSKGL